MAPKTGTVKAPAAAPDPTQPAGPSPRRGRLAIAAGTLSAIVILLVAVVPPHALLAKANKVGYAICHQIPERSFFPAGRQLPLCARCTGTFLGAVLGLGAMLLLRRGRASHLPPPAVLAVLIAFVGLWAFDGLNSYLTFFPAAPHLYEPRNWLRMSTGMLNGLALISLVFPVFNFTLWSEPAAEPGIRNVGELALLLLVAAPVVLAVQAEIGFLLYPVAILSSLGVLLLLTLLNSMLAAIALRREGQARTWRQALASLSSGLALALIEIVALDLMRDWLTARFGLMF
jgi:uncharacterized membrane protein